MIFSVVHKTTYNYANNVTYCYNLANLKPKTFDGQELLDYELEIEPKPTVIKENIDFFGNNVTHFSIEKQHKKLVVTAKSKVLRSFEHQKNAVITEACRSITLEQALLKLKVLSPENIDATQYVLDSAFIKKISDKINNYAKISFRKERSVFEATNELMKRIFTEFKFDPSFSSVATPIDEVMEAKKGVCQDFAQVAIACLRSVGMPARYVSGYIETFPPPGKEKLFGTDASHAWFSVYIPNFGWIDFDPTNNQIPKNQHIIVAYGRDYYDVPPLKGVIYGSGESTLEVSVDIRPFKNEVQQQQQQQQ
ncbi:transglutaminase family protein [Polaribacter porphyrae]|uniref:Transglutaminase n=1 Tax=Polaribacter porphyrae TaxID=1137780 RepID=A0A2S7WLZ4_9FLAO|nr:transglutaminase family protein [Polaribacter porphyrae]PQJ78311.1 transglutaminase [Polaribacter porphyrae]